MMRKIGIAFRPHNLLNIQNWLLSSRKILEIRTLSAQASSTTEIGSIDTGAPVENGDSKKNLSKAMKAYLDRAREHDEFMNAQRVEFEIGKRHLANMMGENPETFTQADIDNAIEYLFPSGLYQKHARPIMKPPEEVFPQRKAAEFDETGRPYHFLFYTGRSNFYQVLYDVVEHINEMYKFEDSMTRKNLQPDPMLKLNLSGTEWIAKSALEFRVVETVSDREYNTFVTAMDRLSNMPFAYKVKDFIMEYRVSLMNQSETYDAIKPQIREDGRESVTVYECRRKRAIGNVTVISPGTGKITINGQGISYFEGIQEREQVSLASFFLRSLWFTQWHLQFDKRLKMYFEIQ
ncbi:hypothetical protein HUJ04_008813 [Dendroctonus ponderosae]|nr:hypothetical protein HUJ04_008813 [Dendroctonus ponderosae]KAH1002757.1 hypothetical protein HUJ04_008813 [Dendroctonus ponderosae]